MSKYSLIQKYFQKANQLTISNKKYCDVITSLFKWMTANDKVKADITSGLLTLRANNTARIVSHQQAVIAGVEEISFLASTFTNLSFKPLVKDGEKVKNGQTIAAISGKSYEILAYERTILNILQRMSGIATETNFLSKSLKTTPGVCRRRITTPGVNKPEFPHPFIAATRKTPWMTVDKKAVAVAGGLTHRLDLADGILIKDNHLAALKKYYHLKTNEQAIKKALEIITPARWPVSRDSWQVEESKPLIEIEVESESQADLVIKTFQQLPTLNHSHYLAILLDNFSPSQAKSLLNNLRNLYDLSGIIFEASGGINERNILEFAQTGVDIISLGSLTHSTKATNFSLEIS